MNDEPVLPHLETITQAYPAVQYCLEEARSLLRRVQEILQAAVLDPQTYYEESRRFYHTLPPMAALESFAPLPPDLGEVGNSPDTPSSDLSDEDSYEPATPLHHSEFE